MRIAKFNLRAVQDRTFYRGAHLQGITGVVSPPHIPVDSGVRDRPYTLAGHIRVIDVKGSYNPVSVELHT